VKCGTTPVALNAKVTASEMLFGDVAQYECEAGYALANGLGGGPPQFGRPMETKSEVDCLATGAITPVAVCVNINDCAGRTCGPHGSCVDHLQNYTCACEDGFEQRMKSNGDLFCGNVDDCPSDNTCTDHGTCLDLLNDYTCECESGYELDGTAKVCQARICPEVPGIANSDMASKRVLKYPDFLEVTCEHGYTIDGTPIAAAAKFGFECQADATVSPVAKCLPVQCGFAPLVQLVASGPDVHHQFVFGEKAEYACPAGFSFDGTSSGATTQSLECQADGTFPAAKDCAPVTCGAPPTVSEAVTEALEVKFGSSVNYQCNVGYSFVAADATKSMLERPCLATGVFKPPAGGVAPACSRVSCGEAPVFEHATHVAGLRSFGDVVDYTCEDGSSIDGTLHGLTEWAVSCTGSGLYSAAMATSCQTITFSVHGNVQDATNLHYVGGASVKLTAGGVTMEGTTDSSGSYAISGVPMGDVELQASKDGFIAGEKTLHVMENVMSGESGSIFLSPTLPMDSWRIVMNWASRPRDMDSHLYFGSRRACHIAWNRKRVNCGNEISAVLDVDDTNGNGPETTTINDVDKCKNAGDSRNCKMVFKVHNYNRRPPIADSEAVVVLFNGNHEVARYTPAQGVLNGDWWSVFSIDGKTGEVSVCATRGCR